MNGAPVYPLPAQIGTPRSGLLQLRNAVAVYFEEYDVGAAVAPVGLKYRSFTLNQSAPANANRVVFIPGVFDGNEKPKPRDYGVLSRRVRNSSSVQNPRELLTWDRPITISCWSAPEAGNSKDEGATLNLAEDLVEQVVRAVQVHSHADIEWGAVTINMPSTENNFGVELLLAITQRGPLYGVTLDYAQPRAVLTADDVEITT